MRGMDREKKAFTLIELLVVVAIIVVLIALLLPALGAARRSAKTVGCLSNLRQTGVALVAYASEFGLCLPPGETPNYASDWQRILSDYVAPTAGGTTNTKMMRCPGALVAKGDFHFSAHIQLFPDFSGGHPPPAWIEKQGSLREVQDRGDTLALIFDGTQNGSSASSSGNADPMAWNVSGVWDFFEESTGNNNNHAASGTNIDMDNQYVIRWRHGNSDNDRAANFLLGDFHAETRHFNIPTMNLGFFRANRNGRKNSWQ